MPSDRTKLRSLCNAHGISCRGPNGGYLSDRTLIQNLQQVGAGPAAPAPASASVEDDSARIQALRDKIAEEHAEMIDSDSDVFIFMIYYNIYGEFLSDVEARDVNFNIDIEFARMYRSFLTAIRNYDSSASIRALLKRYPNPENNEKHMKRLRVRVTEGIRYNNPQLLAAAKSIYEEDKRNDALS